MKSTILRFWKSLLQEFNFIESQKTFKELMFNVISIMQITTYLTFFWFFFVFKYSDNYEI